jgi:hypothetical protein
VIVQPSCVQVPSITVNAVSLVREMRNRPAVDSTRAVPPTFASGVPAVVTCTRAFVNRPCSMLKSEAEPPPLGDVGEPSPAQAATSVASVAQDAT